MNSNDYIKLDEEVGAHNYHPLEVVISKAEGAFVFDVEGKKYLDMLSAYSAMNHGHRHPKIIEALKKQTDKVTLTSRAFHNDKMGLFLQKLTKLTGYDKALPMNTGAEAVETAIKASRRWGYLNKKIPEDRAEIVVCEGNFHGRTTTIVSFSTDPNCRDGFGPFTPGFKIVPYGDEKALKNSISNNTVAFMVEPIQGEGGVLVPPDGYLKKCREICSKAGILFIADEIQTGLGRTGKLFCCDHENVRPDIICIGKALGGGVYPVSAIVADNDIMKVFVPGNHGSTFGGNPLASAVAISALDVLIDENLPKQSLEKGQMFIKALREIKSNKIKEVRGKGLMIGLELKEKVRPYCCKLKENGILAKDTHEFTIRFAPPLITSEKDLMWAADVIKSVMD